MITPANTGVLGALTGKTSDGKTFDNVEYENALKSSGYTDEEARAYWNPRRDPYSQESISDFISSQVPKVSIQDDDITISAPKDVLDSPLVSQIKTELGSLKGADLKNPEVKNAIDRLNEEIKTSFSSNINQALGWTQEEYNEYQRAIQAASGSNPMSSKDLFAWGPDGKAIADEKGEIIMKTPSEWIEYWQGNYTPEERTELFKKSLQSNKPRERVMALFMAGPGSTRPVYGYTEGERLGQVFNAAASEMGKFPEGLVRLLGEDNNTKRLESLQKKTNIPVESLRKFNISNDEAFNSKINSIIGRAWNDLTDDEKAFVLEVGVSKGNPLLSEWEQKAFPRDKSVDALESALSSDNEISKEAIKTVLEGSSFDKYKEVRDNYDTWQGYDDWTKEDDVKMAENEIWSGISSQAGRVIGTIGRFLWEDAVVRGLTGGISLKSITNPSLATGAAAKEIASKGISMNRLSDKIAGSYETGAGIVGWLGRHNISPSSTVGKRLIEFGANLVGTIPEDILQTAVDNVVTYNPDENANLLDPTQMAESFRNNLIVMSLFNAARVGFNQIRLNRLANKIAKNADLSQPFDADGLASDADDLARAVREGQGISTNGGVVSVDDGDGGRKVLNNITSEQAKMAQQTIRPQEETLVEPWDNESTRYYKRALAQPSIDDETSSFYRQRLEEETKKAKANYYSKKIAQNELNDGEFFEAQMYASPEGGRYKIYAANELSRGGEAYSSGGDVTFYTPYEWYAKTYNDNIVRNPSNLNTFVYNSQNAYNSELLTKLSDAVHSSDSYKNATNVEKAEIDNMLVMFDRGPVEFSEAVYSGNTMGPGAGEEVKIPQAIKDGFKKLGIDAVEIPGEMFPGHVNVDLEDGGIGHQTEVIVFNQEKLSGPADAVSARNVSEENYSRIGIAQQRNDISAIPEELQSAWYENGDRAARESIADIIESNPTVRNASLNKFYEDYLYWQRALDHQPLPFDEWLDSDIVLYRYSDPSMDSGSKTLSYSVVPGGLPLMGGDVQAIVIKPRDTLGKSQLTGTAAENEVFVRSDIANKKSPAVGTYEYAVMEDNILRNKDSSSTAAKRAMTTREIDVWSSKNLKDGDKVYTSSSEADADFGHNNVAKHTIQLSDAEWDDINHGVYKAQSGVEAEPTTKVIIEVDTPDGKVLAEAPDYRPRNFDEAVKLKVEPTAPAVLHGQNVKLDAVMNSFQNDFLPEFRNKFGDVQTSDFDWVFHNSRNGLTPEEIIGTVNPETNRTVTKEMIDAMKWWADSPYTKDLRMASRNALGMEGDFNILGYLPHTTYDPTNMSFEEALTGRLWQQYTGASMTDEGGNYKGFGGDLQSRYRTFASNMLWDSMNNEVAAAKLMEEAQMDGVDLAPEQAVKAVEGEKEIRQKVNDAPSSKELTKALSSDSDDIDWGKIDDNIKKQAETSGLGKAIHDNYQDVYYGANGSAVGKQGNAVVNSFDTLGNRMRNTTIGNGMSMYDWGGADLVYAPKNAAELVARYMNEGGDFRDMLIEYIENHSHRSPQYAESVADKWMAKLGEIPGELNKGKVIYSLGNSMKWEAMTRLKKWLTMANYDQFNDSTKKMIDRFLFNHMQMDSIKNNPTIGQKLTKALDTLTGLRYRALFYGNIKNALLQTSELNRYFSSFKWGDVAQMAKRLATDENFRARVNTYVDAVAPSTSYLDAELYGKFSNVADSMDVEENGVRFRDLGKKTKETADAIGLGPIEAAESFKNHMMVAGLVQEADRLGLTGDEALRHIRRRFERVGLAADEMGRIGLSSNPLAKTMLFLQNFQIRELGMHLYNIMDEWKLGNSVPKKVLNATKYLTKVLGAKLATTLILARLGYSASQTMGLDPFGLLDNYTGMDEDDMEWVDKQIAGGMLTPFFSGGMTSLLADMYFMARKAYEDSSQQTVSDEAEQRLESSWGLAMPELTFDRAMEGAKNFVPGNVFLNRLNQMNEMMDTGWATSASGNKMYTAPQDALNTILGYLFGRSATQNAQQYNQSYGDNLLQTLGRFNPFREYGEFDPIDTKNYSDWFKGDDNDLQQFNKGRYWFQNERDRILGEYQKAIEDSYATSEDISEAQNTMNRKLDDLYDQLERFVAAYEKKNGTISPNMVKQVLNILNTGKNTVGETQEQRDARQLEDSSKALERYSQLGLSPVGTYTGPTKSSPDKETKYQGSPQYRAAVSGYYDIPDEVVRVLKLADNDLAPIREQIQSKLSHAYSIEDWDTVGSIQKDYLEQFDQVVAPIIASYGNSVLSSTDVSNQLKDMLSTGTNKRSGNLIPSDQYAQNKRGRYQSMPFESVDVGKWAQQRYSGDVYKQPTIRSYSTAEEDLEEIKKLSASGRPSRARARALELKVRVDNQERSLSKKDYQWLMDFLNKKGEQ